MARTKQTARKSGQAVVTASASVPQYRYSKPNKKMSSAAASTLQAGKRHKESVTHCRVMPRLEKDPAHKHYRRKAGHLSLMEIAYYQKRIKLLVPKISFARVVREVGMDHEVVRMTDCR